MSYKGFEAFLSRGQEAAKAPLVVIGGAYGLVEQTLGASAYCLSLGPMTLPHALARVVLFEKLYRAATILAGTGYHH